MTSMNGEGYMKMNLRKVSWLSHSSYISMAAMVVVLLASLLRSTAKADQAQPTAAGPDGLSEKVRHELVMLPFYGVYDDLNFEVTGDTVKLTGQVTRPTLKSDAEAVVRRIPGVSNVTNEVSVLPLSPWDNRVRRASYLTLFNANSPLFRYGLGADPSIHIIVENGNVTLKGVVSRESDKQIASMFIKQISGVFSVTNDLKVSQSGKIA